MINGLEPHLHEALTAELSKNKPDKTLSFLYLCDLQAAITHQTIAVIEGYIDKTRVDALEAQLAASKEACELKNDEGDQSNLFADWLSQLAVDKQQSPDAFLTLSDAAGDTVLHHAVKAFIYNPASLKKQDTLILHLLLKQVPDEMYCYNQQGETPLSLGLLCVHSHPPLEIHKQIYAEFLELSLDTIATSLCQKRGQFQSGRQGIKIVDSLLEAKALLFAYGLALSSEEEARYLVLLIEAFHRSAEQITLDVLESAINSINDKEAWWSFNKSSNLKKWVKQYARHIDRGQLMQEISAQQSSQQGLKGELKRQQQHNQQLQAEIKEKQQMDRDTQRQLILYQQENKQLQKQSEIKDCEISALKTSLQSVTERCATLERGFESQKAENEIIQQKFTAQSEADERINAELAVQKNQNITLSAQLSQQKTAIEALTNQMTGLDANLSDDIQSSPKKKISWF